ncbi:NADH-quinone oxidoreductase subunit C [Rhodoflexus sp.]
MIDIQTLSDAIQQFIGSDNLLSQEFGSRQSTFTVKPEVLVGLCEWLQRDHYFDHLNCITAVDNGEKAGTIDLIYHLTALTQGTTIALRIVIPRGNPPQDLPQAPSLTGLWRTADWHEREAYDLFGITFTGHPDLRRILLPADWQGYPLRKDYDEQENYHGIKVKY